jgi:hypothetical protein
MKPVDTTIVVAIFRILTAYFSFNSDDLRLIGQLNRYLLTVKEFEI